MGAENRNHPRAPIELKVEYKRLNTFFADYTKNISRGGTFIKTPRPLPIGTEFVFQLTVPTLDAPVELKGEVTWLLTPEQSANGGGDPGMGIRFIFENDGQRQAFEQAVEKLMVDSLGENIYRQLMTSRGG
jgi:type IV pilus assembly protein PilZ